MVVQLSKAVFQAALQDGSWRHAQHIVLWDDPLAPEEHAGDEEVLMASVKYQKSLRELRNQFSWQDRPYDKKRQGGNPDGGAGDDDAQADDLGKGEKHGKGRKQK